MKFIKLLFKSLKKAKKSKTNKKKELTLPLYFGWELVLRKVDDLKKHIVGPFKEYWQYLTAVIVLILMVSTVFVLHHYSPTLAATYGWVQSDWSGGASTTAMDTHTNEQANPGAWNKYQSADTNVNTATPGQVKLNTGTSGITDSTTAQFNAMAQSGEYCINISTAGNQVTATNKCYDAAPYGCGNFYVKDVDNPAANWANAKSECAALGTDWVLPDKNELHCMCLNQANLGSNFVSSLYWSSTPYYSYAYVVRFSGCASYNYGTSYSYRVRCIRSY